VNRVDQFLGTHALLALCLCYCPGVGVVLAATVWRSLRLVAIWLGHQVFV
jgi:hypothetical protein